MDGPPTFARDDAHAARGVRVWTVLSAALGGAALARVALAVYGGGLMEQGPGEALPLMASTGVWTGVTVALCLRGRHATALLFVLAPLFGCVNAGTVCALLGEGLLEAIPRFLLGCLLGSLVGVPLGLGYAFVLAPLTHFGGRLLRRGGLDGPDHAALGAAAWVTSVGAALGALPSLIDRSAGAALLLLGAVAAGLSLRNEVRRARFLAALRVGRAGPFRFTSLDDAPEELPALTRGDGQEGVVSVARDGEGDGPFRQGRLEEARYRVTLPDTLSHRLRGLAAVLLLGVQVAFVVVALSGGLLPAGPPPFTHLDLFGPLSVE